MLLDVVAPQDGLNLRLGPIVVNLVEPQLDRLDANTQTTVDTDAFEFLSARISAERHHINDLATKLALPRVELPRLDTAPNANAGLEDLAEVLLSGAL